MNLFQNTPITVLNFLPALSRNIINCPGYVYLGTCSTASPFRLIHVSALFIINVVFYVLICSPATVLMFVSSFTISCTSPLDLAKKYHNIVDPRFGKNSTVDIKSTLVTPVQSLNYVPINKRTDLIFFFYILLTVHSNIMIAFFSCQLDA